MQCIYFDPPYGITPTATSRWSTTSRDVKDGNADHITREPEQVKAFRDTWRDGIHSYLTYLRDRLMVARDLLTESGSIFVQIGDENVHRVRAVLDEVFGDKNFISLISVQTTSGFATNYIGNVTDYILWFAKDKTLGARKARSPMYLKDFVLGEGNARWLMFPDFTYRGVSAAENAERLFQQTRFPTSRTTSFRKACKGTSAVFIPRKNIRYLGQELTLEGLVLVGRRSDFAKAGRIHVAENSDSIYPLSHRLRAWRTRKCKM